MSEAPTEIGKHLAGLLPNETSGWHFFFAGWNAHMYCGCRSLTYEWV